jgi:hypothetical protein
VTAATVAPRTDAPAPDAPASDEDAAPSHRPATAGPVPDDAIPPDVVDRLLWRDAQRVLVRHRTAGPDGRCDCCDAVWPCTARRLAERAENASRMPWRDGWTTRHDLNAMLALPQWRQATTQAVTRPRRPRPYGLTA